LVVPAHPELREAPKERAIVLDVEDQALPRVPTGAELALRRRAGLAAERDHAIADRAHALSLGVGDLPQAVGDLRIRSDLRVRLELPHDAPELVVRLLELVRDALVLGPEPGHRGGLLAGARHVKVAARGGRRARRCPS